MTTGAPALDGAPARGRRAAPLVVAVTAVAAGAIAFELLGDDGDKPRARASAAVATGVATAQVRDLVDREDVEGTLGFAGARSVASARAGTLTDTRAAGSVARRGTSLFSIDGRATAFVLYGRTPAYRALRRGVADGDDVLQLERNLVALGYDPVGAVSVDGDFGAATAAAVRRWEDARGVREDGVVEQGEIVFTAGPVRVGGHDVARGETVAPGRPVLRVSSRRRVVTARLAAGRQSVVRRGQRVRVTLPDGSTVAGRVRRVGRVARTGRDGAEATVGLQATLRGRAARRLRLDGAPVTVSVARTAARRALAVPVQALVATGANRYAVEVLERGGRRLVAVRVGSFADGWVEVSGRGLRDGVRVAVPR